jgi:oxygen-independent coproporphyrinogen-3 oxidase
MTRGLYIHIPFCNTICSYCDFFILKNEEDELSKYLDLLSREIDLFVSKNSNKLKIDSIFIGGGTPSLLSPDQLNSLINKLSSSFEFTPDIEISMESNPASIDLEKLNEYKSIGINRISIGVQSFVKRELGILKRNHSPKIAERALSAAVSSGIETINLDLIFSIPGQSLASWTYSLEKAIDMGTNHLSTYNLTFEENTPLWNKMQNGKVVKYNDEVDEFMYFTAIEILSEKGFDHYEISNFSKDNNKCNHNLNTWRSGEYLAFGTSSHGYFNNSRYKNVSNLKLYYKYLSDDTLPIIDSYKVGASDELEELIILGLRAEGLDLKSISKFDNSFQSKSRNFIIQLLKDEYLKEKNYKLKLTSKGYALCDSLTTKFLDFIY